MAMCAPDEVLAIGSYAALCGTVEPLRLPATRIAKIHAHLCGFMAPLLLKAKKEKNSGAAQPTAKPQRSDPASLDEFMAQPRENAESVAGDAVSQTDGVGP